MQLFLTGATGFIGGELLVALAQRVEIDRIYCLVRAENITEATRRLDAVFDFRADHAGRAKVVPIVGGLGDPALASGLMEIDELRAVNIVIHAAADTSFAKSSDTRVEQINIGGTCQIVEWARRLGRLHLFVYVGTASICGTDITHRVVHEDETPNAGAQHAVKYSYTKMVGETLVRQAFPAEQILIVRPSIVMGDGRDLAPRSYVILWALQAMYLMRLVPVDGHASLDMIPVDYVVRAMLALLFGRRRHMAYHISSGPAGATNGHLLFESLADGRPDLPAYRFIDRALIPQIRDWTRHRLAPGAELNDFPAYLAYWGEIFKRRGDLRVLLAGLEPYFTFVELGQVFDNARLLADTALDQPEPAHSYIRRSRKYLQNIDVLRGALDP
jgi:nucleoside-diphosphate-sugar epimerase